MSTVAAALVVAAPRVSVTRAVSVCGPALVGAHASAYGLVVLAEQRAAVEELHLGDAVVGVASGGGSG